MNARDMVETMTERDAKIFLLSLLAATLNAVDASDTGRKHAVKCLEMTAAQGLCSVQVLSKTIELE